MEKVRVHIVAHKNVYVNINEIYNFIEGNNFGTNIYISTKNDSMIIIVYYTDFSLTEEHIIEKARTLAEKFDLQIKPEDIKIS